MATHHHYRGRWTWLCSLGAALLVTVLAWSEGWAQGREPAPEAGPIAVSQERLSVNVRETDVREVLTQVAQQTGITIIAHLHTETRVSASFTDLALDTGLRHLLRIASLSHAMRYSRGSTGAVVLTEVDVFEAAPGETSLPQQVAEPEVEDRSAAGPSAVAAFIQALGAAPPAADEETRHAAESFHEWLGGTHQRMSPPEAVEQSEQARILRPAPENAQ